MGLADCIFIFALCSAAGVVSDRISKKLTSRNKKAVEIDEKIARLETQIKDLESGKNVGRNAGKHIPALKEELTKLKASSATSNFPATLVTMIFHISLVYGISSLFYTQVMAVIPFEPTTLMGVRTMFRRGLAESEPLNHVGYLFFFILSNMVSRFLSGVLFPDPNAKKAAANPFSLFMDQYNEMSKKVM